VTSTPGQPTSTTGKATSTAGMYTSTLTSKLMPKNTDGEIKIVQNLCYKCMQTAGV